MPDYVSATILKYAREEFGIEQYPMSVYINVSYQQYVDWETGRVKAPPEMVDFVESLNRLPHIDIDRNPEQYSARLEDMKELSKQGHTNAYIGRRWGVTTGRVWQILHGSEGVSPRAARLMENQSAAAVKEKLLDTVKRMGLSASIQADIAKELNTPIKDEE